MTDDERRADAAEILVRRLAEEDSHFRALPAEHRSPFQQRHHAMMVLSAVKFFLKVYDRHQLENIVIDQMMETFELANHGKIAPMAYVPGRKELKANLARSEIEVKAHAAAVLEYSQLYHRREYRPYTQKEWAKKIADALGETGFGEVKPITVIGWRNQCNDRSHDGTDFYIMALDWWSNDLQGPEPECVLKAVRQRAIEIYGPKSDREYVRKFEESFREL